MRVNRVFCCVISVFVLTSVAMAWVPLIVNVQGRLTNASGVPLPAGTKSFTFKIFNASTNGTEVWPNAPGETQSVTTDEHGLWTAQLGALNPISEELFPDTTLWLQITVDDGVNPITTLPRVRLTTSPYAFSVGTVDGALGGQLWGELTVGPAQINGGNYGFVAGYGNTSTSTYGTVTGYDNTSSGYASCVTGGFSNDNNGDYSVISGGHHHSITANGAAVGGGAFNVARGTNSVVAGGGGATAADSNLARGSGSAVLGGQRNVAWGQYSSVGGGRYNFARGAYSVIAGGGGASYDSNLALGDNSVIGGGARNVAFDSYATVGGGRYNVASDAWATVSGGDDNVASGYASNIGGGQGNNAIGYWTAIGGGNSNDASGLNATVPGGRDNAALGDFSFAAGYNAKANHDGCFVWSDAEGLPSDSFKSSGVAQFLIRASGGTGIGTSTPGSSTVLNVADRFHPSYIEMIQFNSYADPDPSDDIVSIGVPSTAPDDCQFIECERGISAVFRVWGNGDVTAAGTVSGGGADFAELVSVSEGSRSVEPGDVLTIDPTNPRALLRSSTARSTLVSGVYSTAPGFIASEHDWDQVGRKQGLIASAKSDDEPKTAPVLDLAETIDEVPLAVVGIVPCKVSAENGPIRPGDLLVTSSTPGHAMRDENPRVGTVLGKALEPWSTGQGKIKVLVTLQ